MPLNTDPAALRQARKAEHRARRIHDRLTRATGYDQTGIAEKARTLAIDAVVALYPSALELLTHGRALIANIECWTTGTFARNVLASATCAYGDRAVCWCAQGTLEREAGLAGEALLRQPGGPYYHHTSHVVAYPRRMLDEAATVILDRLEAEGRLAQDERGQMVGLVDLNDLCATLPERFGRTEGHALVMEMFDAAIQRLTGEAATKTATQEPA